MSLHRVSARAGSLVRARCAVVANLVSPPCIGLRYASTAAPASVADTGFWKSLVPKPLRKENRQSLRKKSKEWNPATYFIVMFLFIGSMSIQMIALRKQTEQYARQSSNRIAQLREVVQRIQNGEDVDVEKALGTGDPQKEAEWEEVLRAIEKDEPSRKPHKEKKQQDQELKAQESSPIRNSDETPTSEQPPAKTKTASLGNFF
ncbi:hypothetical protein JDV02_007432 [Purpureocillium takamizusanense]|uniref:Uncharacterized protein n=1 Tax=Purpureocillium takamizusanense TaxID=2060973 RepID=A0A9Q8VDQ4_9HYPO|nr:uncharacterized protein JDV02_007432 [Purpureocillium takamizusanense]UNI21441.1 hypothetical protein JDV02_007432 [Purpureocillium takamizusanense]